METGGGLVVTGEGALLVTRAGASLVSSADGLVAGGAGASVLETLKSWGAWKEYVPFSLVQCGHRFKTWKNPCNNFPETEPRKNEISRWGTGCSPLETMMGFWGELIAQNCLLFLFSQTLFDQKSCAKIQKLFAKSGNTCRPVWDRTHHLSRCALWTAFAQGKERNSFCFVFAWL